MKRLPNFEFKRIKLAKTHTVLTFRRNNLNYEEFFYEDGKFVFEEKFEIGQNRGTFRMSVKCKRFDDIFNHSSEEIEIRGSKTHFGILLTLPDYAKPPVSEFGENEYVQYWLFFHGGKLRLENRYALARKMRREEEKKRQQKLQKEQQAQMIQQKRPTHRSYISPARFYFPKEYHSPRSKCSSLEWSVDHPYVGGRFSPK